MANYFPMFIDISKWRILMVGGGKVAARRVETLTHFAADITVIAPEIEETLVQLEAEEKIRLFRKLFEEKDLLEQEWDMVLAATDNPKLNEKIAIMCRERNIPVNRADCKEMCDFFFPSIVEKNGVVIGINSGGDNPGKVKNMRKQIEKIQRKEL